MAFLIVLCALYAVSLALYLLATHKGGFLSQLIFKTLTSVLFIGVALAAHGVSRGGGYFWWVLAALVCSLAGDVLLQLQRQKSAEETPWFALGGGAFLLAHCCFIAAFSTLVGFGWEDGVVFFAACIVMLLVFSNLRLEFGGLLIPGFLYTAAILMMMTKALSVTYLGGGLTPLSAIVGAGALLFVVSDTVLALKNFHPSYRSSLCASQTVSVTYYAAQLLFAISILYA